MEEKKKIRTICIDTLTGIQETQWMTEQSKPRIDDWMDYSKELWSLLEYLQKAKFNLIFVIGDFGTGKSTGMRTLPSGTNIWFNADKKDPCWVGGRKEYGKINEKTKYHVIPTCYGDIVDFIKKNEPHFETERYAILIGHSENYKDGNEYKKRLRTLGKIATKLSLEGKSNTTFYTNVERGDAEIKYVLETQNDGFNTARSPMGLFEPVIENDYNFVIQKLLEY